jgi:hypothetical protein
VPQKEQRYETLGDWIWKGSRLEIRLSREFTQRDPRYGVLLLTHELLEALLCRSAGISTQQVDAFDVSFKGEGEPGMTHRRLTTGNTGRPKQPSAPWPGSLASNGAGTLGVRD